MPKTWKSSTIGENHPKLGKNKMQEYISKTVSIQRQAEDIYVFFSDFGKFSQLIPREQIDDFLATADECTFTVKGIAMGLKILNREPFSMIKYMGIGKVPFEFLFWVQLKQVAPYDTRMRLVLHAKMNMMLKMMLKNKIQTGLDSFAEQISSAFNGNMQYNGN
ncbi:MAG: polyketide cyclase [Prevotellaceae bacterium]|jgi:carbon monoxide dehydrogenase subunit G|nr:polyketide cyclase [Prevotellaceae bacterium]